MKAFLIDPELQTITEVDTDASLDELYALLDCSLIEHAQVNEHVSLIVDEEGLLYGNKKPFIYDGFPNPLVGKALAVGIDYEMGAIAEPLISREELLQKVYWVNDGYVECAAITEAYT